MLATMSKSALKVTLTDGPGRLERALAESDWLGGEVRAAGVFRQGKPVSIVSMITGTAAIELLRRRWTAMPRQFVLAATGDRLVAFKALTVGYGEPTDADYRFEVRLKPGEIASFPLAEVAVTGVTRPRGELAATLAVGGDRFPIMQAGEDYEGAEALVALLAR